ncbi:uncharacterized protein KY384_002203 [Bacidia gigantensis]|uniref:uncharacterized protein n=1 Tax=Bacidia gigantensis TaxID=2732470 RepID=UPI001D056C9B|nr:uncharacterized protein KY384_002203 [Bacidia gigantensis]KAG8533420.1 hypothetical protein KY384_002203 [Bacidia gigantensis]
MSARRNAFLSRTEPLQRHASLELQHDRISGPLSFLNPTRAVYTHLSPPVKPSQGISNGAPDGHQSSHGDHPASRLEFKWRSRDNRKGRHTLLVDSSTNSVAPSKTTSLREVCKGILRMLTQFPYWDISWLVATIFTLGSVVWVMNSFFAWLPDVAPSTEFDKEILYAGGITAFIGATIFEIGSILLIIEAANEHREGCFGWALERLVEGDDSDDGGTLRIKPDSDRCAHHHTNKKNLVGKGDTGMLEKTVDERGSGKGWTWFPSRYDLTNHYLRELGFLAALAQLCGATIFWISGFTALPGINDKLSKGLSDGIFWTPQIVGGSGFIVSGTLYMLETQEVWYRPAFQVLGWHIGFWNFIGAIGFTLCGALGPASFTNSGALYQSSLATFWGSWAFLIGSTIQWYESLDKHPVEVRSNNSNF